MISVKVSRFLVHSYFSMRYGNLEPFLLLLWSAFMVVTGRCNFERRNISASVIREIRLPYTTARAKLKLVPDTVECRLSRL